MGERDQHAGGEPRTAAKARALAEDRDHFIHVASHDLREPLRQIAGLCAAVLRDYSERLDERGREYLLQAVAGATRMGSLIEAIGAYARLGADNEVLTWFDARESLDIALERLAEPIRVAGAAITADALPCVFGTATRLPSVFQNLIGNAIRHAAAGTTPRIHVSAARHGAFWRFSVSDNGAGIDRRYQTDIFEPFKQFAAADAVGAAGLGLTICRKIVEDMGGAIWVCSSPGNGATFNFTIRTPKGSVATEGLVIEVGGRPAQLLLVEDSAGDVLLTQDAFLTAGLANPVRVARDGLEALDILHDGAEGPGADLVLLDLNLPRMDGRDLLRAVRADPGLRSVKIIVMSGLDGERERLGTDGADGWLSKPIDVARLGAVLRDWPSFQIKDATRASRGAP